MIRTIYGAVRDQNWNAIEGWLTIDRLERSDDFFRLEFTADHEGAPISFLWKGTIEGRGGVLEFRFDGRARSSFLRNRIGLCLLHPIAECAGKECRVRHSDGTSEESAFPLYISPHQPFKDIAALSWEPSEHLRASVQLEGEIFEMEDQRNWTDASFKTYSTPLELPFPVRIAAGEEVHQRILLTLSGGGDSVAVIKDEPVTITLPEASERRPIPKLGLCASAHGQSHSRFELECLARLRLNHLRANIHFSRDSWPAGLRRVQEEARAINARLQCALFLTEAAKENFASFREAVDPGLVDICLIFHEAEKSTSSRWFDLAQRELEPHGFRIGTGTNAYFTELNRQRPPRHAIACYSLNPQVHTFDDLSVVETLEAQPVTVASARQFCDRELIISPISLLPRFNPNATDPSEQQEDPESTAADPRQSTLFCAAWTTGSLAHLLPLDRLESITYYETKGPRGIMQGQEPFPAYHVFEALAGARLLRELSISRPGLVTGFAVVNNRGGSTCLLANLTGKRQRTELHLPVPQFELVHLDETNVSEARMGRLPPLATQATDAGRATLELAPHALLRLELP